MRLHNYLDKSRLEEVLRMYNAPPPIAIRNSPVNPVPCCGKIELEYPNRESKYIVCSNCGTELHRVNGRWTVMTEQEVVDMPWAELQLMADALRLTGWAKRAY